MQTAANSAQTSLLKELMMRSINNAGLPDPAHWDVHKMLKKYSYAFLVMYVLNKVGIERESLILKAIAKVQKDLDAIMNDLNKLKQLLQELENQDWGKDKGKNHPDHAHWDPRAHTDAENQKHMKDAIEKWLKEKDPQTGDSNLKAMQKIWKDLFGDGTKGNQGLVGKLQADLSDPNYDQKDSSKQILGILHGLDGKSFAGSSGDWKMSNGRSFLDILRNSNGQFTANLPEVIKMFAKVYCHSYYNRTGSQPAAKGHNLDWDYKNQDTTNYNDDIGDITQDFETTKGSINGLNTVESSDLSMYAQNITSMIQEAQQIIQYSGQETKTYVGNDIAR